VYYTPDQTGELKGAWHAHNDHWYTGLIGSTLAKSLLANGHQVCGLTRTPLSARLPILSFVLRLVLGGMLTLILDGADILPGRLLELRFVFQHGTIEAALGDLLAGMVSFVGSS
jgi:NAD dependent epimerase/dehydratase family enzyme